MNEALQPFPNTVLVKLTGDVFAPPEGQGLWPPGLQRLAHELAGLQRRGLRVGVVVGGGNVMRGRNSAFIDRISADQIGMLGTAINGLALRAALEAEGVVAHVQSAVPLAFAEPVDGRRARQHLARGEVVVFVAGTGNPLVSTDTAAAVRAVEIGADLLLKGSNVDGVYDGDPQALCGAKKFQRLTFAEVLERRLRVMDLGAFDLCAQHGVRVMVFDVRVSGSLAAALDTPQIGTLISV